MPFADPRVVFTVDFPHDANALEYAVIRISPFADVPVICARGSEDTREGVIYYRNSTGRVQSAAVSNSYDMRDIITTATVKMMRRMRASGLIVDDQPDAAAQARQRLEAERENL